MELSFVANAVLRRWWVVLAIGFIGLVGGFIAGRSERQVYESRALLSLAPASSANSSDFFDPDRYIAGQITVLRSGELAERVAASLDGQGIEVRPAAARELTSAEQLAGTNIVQIAAEAGSPELARALAQQYAEEYIASLRARAADFNSGDLQALRVREDELLAEIEALSEDIAAAVDRYLILNQNEDGSSVQLPSLSVLAPVAEANRQVRVSELNGVLSAITDLELAAAKVNSEIVSNADVPRAPVAESSVLLVAFGLAFGLVLGVSLAVIWSVWSPNILDDQEASDIAGTAVVGNLALTPVIDTGIRAALLTPIARELPAVEQLAVRCEATGGDATPLVVTVTGTDRGAGVSTLSVALAERFSSVGARVVLVDGDGLSGGLTRVARSAAPGVSELVSSDGPVDPSDYLIELGGGASLLGLGLDQAGSRIRWSAVERVLDVAAGGGDVVIVDAGPLMASGSAQRFVELADVTVLAMPARGQRDQQLRETVDLVRDQLSSVLLIRVRLAARAGWGPLARLRKRVAMGPVEAAPISEPGRGVSEPVLAESVEGQIREGDRPRSAVGSSRWGRPGQEAGKAEATTADGEADGHSVGRSA